MYMYIILYNYCMYTTKLYLIEVSLIACHFCLIHNYCLRATNFANCKIQSINMIALVFRRMEWKHIEAIVTSDREIVVKNIVNDSIERLG